MRWKNYSYDLTQNGAVITGYFSDGAETSICIPSYLEGHPVTEIGKEAFSEEGALLEQIEVPATVKKIGNGAFKMCMCLTELILHNGLEEIEVDALCLTPIDHLYLPDSLRRIACPWDLGGIHFEISENNPHFFSDGIGLYGCGGQKSSGEKELLVVSQTESPAEYHVLPGTGVIGESAAAGHPYLKKIFLPGSVRKIRKAAFEGCEDLEEIVLPEGLETIEANAFSQCIRLESLHLPSTLTEIGTYGISDTFSWSDTLNGPKEITVQKGNPVFQDDGASLYRKASGEGREIVRYFGTGRRYQIPEDVVRILPGAFRRSMLFRLDIPASVRGVEENAFRECRNLHEIWLEESQTLLYIPGQPVYRKDEVMELFGSRDSQSRNPGREKENNILPDKWKSFVRDPIYSRDSHEEENPYERYIFDYRGYDGLFHTYLDLPDQYGMAICRLKYPVLLDEEVREKYSGFIRDHLQEILDSIAAAKDREHLADLAELGFFTSENIETCMEAFNRPGCAGLMSYLLDYKQENLKHTEFDFSL